MQEAIVDQFLHFDPITLIAILVGIVGGWYTLRNNSKWHTEWIKKHSKECDDYTKLNNEILSELQQSNARLTTLTEGHHERIARIETQLDRR